MNPALLLELGKAFIPLLPKLIEGKKSKSLAKVAKKSKGYTELAQGGIIGALFFIYQDMTNCGGISIESLACVPNDHWGALCGALALLVVRAKDKASDKNSH